MIKPSKTRVPGIIIGLILLVIINECFGFEAVLVVLLIWIGLCICNLEKAVTKKKAKEVE